MKEEAYWTRRYTEASTGWDIGYPSPALTNYINQIANKDIRILIPGAGHAYEAVYLWEQGFKNVYVLDISKVPLASFRDRLPDFPAHQLLHQDFFSHSGRYDLILEQTFFCALPPSDENRHAYAQKMKELLHPGGKLVGLWFDFPLLEGQQNPPYGGHKALYLSYLSRQLEPHIFERAYHSIPERQGQELFGIFKKAI